MKEYMSFSQYKRFLTCEAAEIARQKGVWRDKSSTAMAVGKYVETILLNDISELEIKLAELEKELEFDNIKLRKKDGELYSEFVYANRSIETVKNDKLMIAALTGLRFVPIEGKIAGTTWKGEIDVLNIDKKYFGDLKCVDEIYKKVWDSENHCYRSIFDASDYYLQIAIYAELLRQKYGELYRGYIVAVSKEKNETPDKEIIAFDCQEKPMDIFVAEKLIGIEQNMPRILAVKSGELEPIRCGKCNYCRYTKTITKPMHYLEYESRMGF
jgi:hypothetical protein